MAVWLDFEKLLKWSNLPEYHLDRVSTAAIGAALARPDILKHVSLGRDGVSALLKLSGPRAQELRGNRDAAEIARLVQYLQLERIEGVRQGQLKVPLRVDREQPWCPGYLFHGGQVLRALQYMGVTSGPFVVSGRRDTLDNLMALARVDPPKDHTRAIFHDDLLRRSTGDVKYRRSRHTDGAMDEEASELGFYPTLPGVPAPPRVERTYD